MVKKHITQELIMFELAMQNHSTEIEAHPTLNKCFENGSLSSVEHQVVLQTISRYADFYDGLDAHIPVIPINSNIG